MSELSSEIKGGKVTKQSKYRLLQARGYKKQKRERKERKEKRKWP